MKQRCDNPAHPDFQNYGGRGVYYSPRWTRFLNFLHDMGDRPEGMTIERIENNGPYYRENCRWASRDVQALNKRNNVRFEHAGRNLTLAEWSRETGIGRVTLLKRLQRGVPLATALSAKGYLRIA